jgi:excisionase family DNA binding protein
MVRFLTIDEVAEHLVVSTRSVKRWIDCGDLRVHRFGRLVRIAEEDLARFLEHHRPEG